MGKIFAWINLVITIGFAALHIYGIKNSSDTLPNKVRRIKTELADVLKKLGAVAAETPETWDDDLIAAGSSWLETIANKIIEELEGGAT